MGMVLEAEHLRLRQSIAIKFLNPNLLGVSEIVQRFDREARAAATLRSRHVVRVTDVEQTPEGVPYMVMEMLDGFDLESERERRGALPYAEAVDYVLQACSALAEAHDAGIVHRDLKPANLFLAKEDTDRAIVKILDFGISKFMNGEDAKLTSAGAIMGTALYMSPEQIRGDASIDARSDIWSLGVILYELIGGKAPWMGTATRVAAGIASEAAPDLRGLCPIPEPLAHAIHSMLEKSPSQRPQTIADVVVAIAPYAPLGSVGAEAADHVVRRSQRNLAASSRSRSSASLPAVATPSSNPLDAGPTLASPRAHPERSTMAATTTTSMNARMGRPRLWAAIAAFAALAVAGVILIFFVVRTKAGAVSATRPPASTMILTSEPTAPLAKADVPSAIAPSAQVSASASAPVAPVAPVVPVAPVAIESARPAATSVSAKRPPVASAAAATGAPHDHQNTNSPAARPTTKSPEPTPAINPPLL